MSNKIKIAVIDDEKLAQDIVLNYLNKHDEIEIVGVCNNGFEGLKVISEEKPDLIFLDIQMPKISGFEMLELLDEPPVIIFSTAFDQFALKAFEVNATDYLLKPFTEDRFNEALQKGIQQLANKELFRKNVNNLVEKYNQNSESIERIVVKQNHKIIIIPTEEIQYLEAQDDYVMIYSGKGNYLKQKTMKYFEENLDSKDFIRIHRSYLAKLSSIKQIDLMEKESYRALLNDGTTLPISKSGYSKLKDFFK